MQTINRSRSLRNRALLTLSTAFTLCVSMATHAAIFCANTAAELQAALTTAAGNNQNNTIKVYVGTYHAPSAGFVYNSNSNHNLDLEGGWLSLGSGNCDLQALNGELTTLDGQNINPVMSIKTNSGNTTGNITVRYFTFQNGLGNPPSLDVIAFNSTGAIRVENSLFRGNHVGTASNDIEVVEISSFLGVVYFLDNAVVDNIGSTSGGALFLSSNDTVDNFAVYVNNNTIAGNTASDASALPGFYPFGQGNFVVSNNIVWDGSNYDVFNSNAPHVVFMFNDVGHFSSPPASGYGDIDQDPKFRDAAHGDYQLSGNSPAKNGGENSPPGTTRNVDLIGQLRLVFAAVDMGAYELQDKIFASEFGG